MEFGIKGMILVNIIKKIAIVIETVIGIGIVNGIGIEMEREIETVIGIEIEIEINDIIEQKRSHVTIPGVMIAAEIEIVVAAD